MGTGSCDTLHMPLPSKRLVQITGLTQSVTLYGAFTPAAQTALSDGWLSVVDFWSLGLPQSSGEAAVEFLYRCLYGKKLAKATIASLSQAEQLNLGRQREGDSTIVVIGDLTGLAGVSADCTLAGNRYDVWRSTTAAFVRPTTAQQVVNSAMIQINAETTIAPDDKAFLRGLVLLRTLAQRFLITSVGGTTATRIMTALEERQFNNSIARSDYPGLAQMIATLLPAVGITTW